MSLVSKKQSLRLARKTGHWSFYGLDNVRFSSVFRCDYGAVLFVSCSILVGASSPDVHVPQNHRCSTCGHQAQLRGPGQLLPVGAARLFLSDKLLRGHEHWVLTSMSSVFHTLF